VIQGLLDLYEASFDVQWLHFANELQQSLDLLFWDRVQGGYFGVTGKDASVLLRMKDDNDSAEPAASSIAALNLARLGAIMNDAELEERARETISAFTKQLSHFPSAMPQMLVAFDFVEKGAMQIVVAGPPENEGTRALLKEIRSHFLPRAVVLLLDESDSREFFSERNAAVRAMKAVDGKPAAYVCRNFSCLAPVTEPKDLARLLATPPSSLDFTRDNLLIRNSNV